MGTNKNYKKPGGKNNSHNNKKKGSLLHRIFHLPPFPQGQDQLASSLRLSHPNQLQSHQYDFLQIP